LTQLTLATDVAGVGTVTSQTLGLSIGNRPLLDLTMNGLMDIAIVDSGLWTTEEMQQLIDLSEV
jgi:hypothetical protein